MPTCTLCGKSSMMLKTNVEGMCEDCQRKTLQTLRIAASAKNKTDVELQRINHQISDRKSELERVERELASKKEQIVETNETLLLQEFGLYEPKYDFATSEQYKERLDQIRQKQKDAIKSGHAASGNINWQVNASNREWNSFRTDLQKLVVRAFNSECDEIISNVKYSNYDASRKRIETSRSAISKLGKKLAIVISEPYFQLKLQELDLAFEYRQMKQREKEEQRELKAQLREEAKLLKEIEEARKKLQKEQNHYQNALDKINQQLETDPDNADLTAKKAELESALQDTEKAIQDVDYREANKKAGYVYIISNIGAFGENVYKIGMTRRLDPQERIDELGDASVPFKFDVHAMIFTDDAPKLENALHHAFENKKVNLVNQRREFFNVTLEEIKEVVKQNFDKTVEFIDTAEAEQYRVSMKMKSQ